MEIVKTTDVNAIYAAIKQTGFTWADEIIHLFIGGSGAHGASLDGKEDLDLFGIYIPPPHAALGVTEYDTLPNGQERARQPELFKWSTAGNDRRNGPDDIDLTLYSLRKWAGMVCTGSGSQPGSIPAMVLRVLRILRSSVSE